MVSLSISVSLDCDRVLILLFLRGLSGKDSYNDQQLGYAYAAAEATGFKVFISFDFAYWTAGGEYL